MRVLTRIYTNSTAMRNIMFFIAVLFVFLFAGISSVNMESLMFGTQSSKSLVFTGAVLLIMGLFILTCLFEGNRFKIKITAIDGLLGLYVFYVLIRNNWGDLNYSLYFLDLLGLIILYVILRQQTFDRLRWILIGLILGGLFQACLGNLQLWGVVPSHHEKFKLIGSFFNPGPYSGYLAAVFPIALGYYLFDIHLVIPFQSTFREILNRSFLNVRKFLHKFLSLTKLKVYYSSATDLRISLTWLYLLTLISMCLVLPASRSRSAWLAVLGSSVYLLFVKYKLSNKIKEYFKNTHHRILIISLLSIVIIGSGIILYKFKKESADGRWLIWKISFSMVKEKPLIGWGFNGFKAHYMDYQARYFERKTDLKEEMLAGDNSYAFNEPLQSLVENGILGTLPLAITSIILFAGYYNKGVTKSGGQQESITDLNNQIFTEKRFLLAISRGSILSILIFSLSSYPMQILPIKIVLIASLAVASSVLIPNWSIIKTTKSKYSNLVRALGIVGFSGILFFTIPKLKLIKETWSYWGNAFAIYQSGAFDDSLSEYKKAYPILKTNGEYLTNYGKALSMSGEDEEAVKVLNEAAKYLPNTVVYTALGDSYKKLVQVDKAEQVYLHAMYMTPSHFYPMYLLAKLYNDTGQNDKARQIAKKLLVKEVKVESTAINEIREEMRKLLLKVDK